MDFGYNEDEFDNVLPNKESSKFVYENTDIQLFRINAIEEVRVKRYKLWKCDFYDQLFKECLADTTFRIPSFSCRKERKAFHRCMDRAGSLALDPKQLKYRSDMKHSMSQLATLTKDKFRELFQGLQKTPHERVDNLKEGHITKEE